MGKGTGLVYKTYLDGGRIFSCSDCGTHLSTREEIISRVLVHPPSSSSHPPPLSTTSLTRREKALFSIHTPLHLLHLHLHLSPLFTLSPLSPPSFSSSSSLVVSRPARQSLPLQWRVSAPYPPKIQRHSLFTSPVKLRHIIHSVNVFEGHCQDRQMTTGLHTVRDIYCCSCQKVLGWRYVSQRMMRPKNGLLSQEFSHFLLGEGI